MGLRSLLLGLGAVTALSGCMTTTYTTGLPGNGVKKEDSAGFFIQGLVGEKSVNLTELCPEGVSSFKSFQSVGNGVFAVCTCGIYTPVSIEVECAGAAKASYILTPDAENNRTHVVAQEKGGES